MENNQLIKSIFKLNGYNLNVENTKYVSECLGKIEKEKYEDFLEKLVDSLTKKNVDAASSLNKATLEEAIKELNYNNQSEKKVELLHVIDAFAIPKSVYCDQSKKLIRIPNDTKTNKEGKYLISNAQSKIELFVQRFKIIHQRTLKHELFSPCLASSSTATTGKKKFQIKPIEYLLSNTKQTEEVIVIGMISQLRENKFYLEDPTGSLPINISEAKFHNGIYTEGCFVLAEGCLIDGVFEVKAIGFPPAETESQSRAFFGNANYFGGPSEVSCKSSIALSQAQLSLDAMIVFISDVWLDSPKVLEKLQSLFIGYSDSPPYAFVMFGNFLSEFSYGLRCDELSDGFKKLANLILQFNAIKDRCHFIFVPGPQDPGVVKVYPRSGILSHCTEYIRKKIPNCHFPSNPCRLEFGSRQIVLFREDLLQKMWRNAIKIPDTQKISEDLTKTLICQAHLTPLPLHVTPVYWNYDHVMRLYPLPDLVVVADKQKAYNHTHSECTIINPGSFPLHNYAFKVYMPSTRVIEDCVVHN